MHQYYYELQIFEDLICGELEPVRLKGEKLQLGRKYLANELGSCQDIKLLKIRLKKHNFEIIEKLNISNAHPLANQFFYEQDIHFEEHINDILAQELFSELGIESNDIAFTFSKSNKNICQIGICLNSSWNEIEHQRVKYCYLYQLLTDCQRKLIKSIGLAVFELKEVEFNKLICRIQKSLFYYLKELQKQHDILPATLDYQVKEFYSNQDCISLIYISLINLLNHLYENYPEEFDKRFPVPFYSETINVNQIDKKINFISKCLKEQQVDPLIVEILNEQFQRILSFKHPNRLTYHELDYFIELLNNLSNYLYTNKSQGVTADDIITVLISHKFNNHKFIQYLTNEIRKDLESTSTFKEKRLNLLMQKKMVEQCIEVARTSFDPESREISQILCDWIEKEMYLIDEQIQHYEDEIAVHKTQTYKLETSLSSKQLAVFIKTLSDADIVVSHSQSEIARWISANFKTSNYENISIAQSRNNLYNSDPRTLQRIKEIGIEIVNIINERLNAKN